MRITFFLDNCIYVAHIPIPANIPGTGVTRVTCAVVEWENTVVQSAVPLSVYAACSGSYISECTSDSGVNFFNILFDYRGHRKINSKWIFTIPLGFNTGEQVHTTEAKGVSRDQGYVHLQKTGQKEKKQKWMFEKDTNLSPLKCLINRDTCVLTVKSTKYLWFFSPTQLLTQGQWWSIFLIHLLQVLPRGERTWAHLKQMTLTPNSLTM